MMEISVTIGDFEIDDEAPVLNIYEEIEKKKDAEVQRNS